MKLLKIVREQAMNCEKPIVMIRYLDKMQLASQEHGEIACVPFSPPDSNTGDSDTLVLRASGSFGSMLFQEMAYEDYTLCYSHYKLQEDTNLNITVEAPFQGLHFALKNSAGFNLEGLCEGVLPKYHYNMIYIPTVQCKYAFQKEEEYTFFSIHFTPAYLQQCSILFPSLSPFLDNAAQRIYTMFSATHSPTTPEMVLIIQNILHCSFTSEQKKIYFEAKVSELLLLALQQITFSNNPTGNTHQRYDVEKIQNAREYLLQHTNMHYSLQELAHLVGTNDYKLKKGFKKLYGTTVHGFVLEERMKNARKMLKETTLSIKKIAKLSGYKNLSNFTAAFKKRFGHPPSTIRRNPT